MDKYILTPQKEEKLVKTATIVFDTSSIGQLYEMTETHKQQLMNIIGYFKNRIWLPAQVYSEYMCHKNKFLFSPINENYGMPKFYKEDMLKDVKSFISKHKASPYFHPYLDDGEVEKLHSEEEVMEKSYKAIKDIVKKQYDKRSNEIRKIAQTEGKDVVYNTFATIQRGKPFHYKDFLEIVKEGEVRYRHSIPPGYMDLRTKEKDGVRIYGDLVIWKEILQYSKLNQKDILFVCDDVKEDWYEQQDKKLEDIDKIIPRKELLQEFSDATQQSLWIVPLSKFIKLLETYINDATLIPFYEGLEAVLIAFEEMERKRKARALKMEYLGMECDRCHEYFSIDVDELDFDWYIENINERSMGDETEYSCTLDIKCPHCGQNIEINPHVWEYPVGVFNMVSLYSNGADVIKDRIVWRNHIVLTYNSAEEDVCEKCGRHGPVGEDGLCEECANEYAYGVD